METILSNNMQAILHGNISSITKMYELFNARHAVVHVKFEHIFWFWKSVLKNFSVLHVGDK
jgi:hypothetical protein